MTELKAKVISYPDKEPECLLNQDVPSEAKEGNVVEQQELSLEDLALSGHLQESLDKRLKANLGEIQLLKGLNRWDEIVTMFYPIEDKEPELVRFGLDIQLRSEVAFALSQLQRFEESIEEYKKCLLQSPEDFRLHSGLGFVLYSSLLALKQKKVLLTTKEKKNRTRQAIFHLKKAQDLRPSGVTAFYRHGMLLKEILQDYKNAAVSLSKAKENWEKYTDEEKSLRHQEYKNYVKSLYSLAGCEIRLGHINAALDALMKCIEVDSEKNFISPCYKGFALGKVFYQLGKLNDAINALLEAEKQAKEEDLDFILELLARTYLSAGRHEDALSAINRIPRNKKRPYVNWTEADIIMEMGNYGRAKALLRKSAERDRRSRHKALVRLAKIAFLERSYGEGMEYSRQAVSFHRETYGTPDPDGLFWGAACSLRAGDIEAAKELASELEAFRPQYPRLKTLFMEIRGATIRLEDLRELQEREEAQS